MKAALLLPATLTARVALAIGAALAIGGAVAVAAELRLLRATPPGSPLR